MAESIERVIERVVAGMRDNLGEPLTVDDLARVAMFSKFHFTRVFQRVTGVSPGRFLSALRLQQAKRLLVSTSLNVIDISIRVGYNSVGTFSARFARSVGMPPTVYRRLGGVSRRSREVLVRAALDGEASASGVVAGRVWPAREGAATHDPAQQVAAAHEASPVGRLGLVFVGLFPSRIPEGRPVRCTVLDEPGPYRLERVPAGVWFLLCQSIPADDPPPAGEADEEDSVHVATHGPLHIHDNTTIDTADLHLAPIRPIDPPVLLALLDRRADHVTRCGGVPASPATAPPSQRPPENRPRKDVRAP